MNRIRIMASVALGLALSLAVSGFAAELDKAQPAECIEHHLSISIEPATQSASIEDQGRIVCRVGRNLLFLKDGASISTFSINDKSALYTYLSRDEMAQLPDGLREGLAGIDVPEGSGLLMFEAPGADTVSFRLVYTAQFSDPVEDVQFSREKVGNEVTGTILDKGAYLSAASCFYPQGAETMARFSLEADVPVTWTAIADGNPISAEVTGDRKIQRFENPYSSDGYTLMAAPYLIKTVAVDSITIATYFFEEDSSLCEKYLTATADYIRMYQDLIGPYPFKQFTVAENFFPTGYGMPGWTLLGQQVLRLPFIITTSLGHEVLHNWWGNSVYVDYDKGNWCEGLTVYGADYRYKLLQSPDAARDYRKDILKEYLSYVNDGNDFPIRQFTSRSSAETRTIGYNKAMMVFHLIEEQIGTEAFFNAWKQAYRNYQGKAITWEDWIDGFQKTSGQDLSFVIPEWIDRAGAPELGLEIVDIKPGGADGKKMVSIKVTQSAETPYHLQIPLRAEGPNVAESTTVELASAEATTEFLVPAEATTITLDPDFHLFRRLYPEEVEPIISAVLGITNKELVSFESDPQAAGPFEAFGSALNEGSAFVRSGSELDDVPRDKAPVVLNPEQLPDYLADLIAVTSDSVTIDGQTYSRDGHTLVVAGKDWNGFDKYLVVVTGDYASLPRLGQLVPHYGKYSYLIFEGAKNVAKGQWPVKNSPLRKSLP